MKNRAKPLSSALDALPEAAAIDVDWAESAMRAGRITGEAVFAELRERLEAKGIDPPSYTGFQRHFLRVSTKERQLKTGKKPFGRGRA